MEGGSRIKEWVYLCQASFLLFVSSTAPETYKGLNYSRAVFLSLLGFERIFSRILCLSCQTFTSDVFFLTSAMTLLWLILFSSLCMCGRICLLLCLLCLCVFWALMFLFSLDTLAAHFLCVFVLLWFQISRQQRYPISLLCVDFQSIEILVWCGIWTQVYPSLVFKCTVWVAGCNTTATAAHIVPLLLSCLSWKR